MQAAASGGILGVHRQDARQHGIVQPRNPDDILDEARIPPVEREAVLKRELAVQLYARELLLKAAARRLSGMDRVAFDDLLGQRGIPPRWSTISIRAGTPSALGVRRRVPMRWSWPRLRGQPRVPRRARQPTAPFLSCRHAHGWRITRSRTRRTILEDTSP